MRDRCELLTGIWVSYCSILLPDSAWDKYDRNGGLGLLGGWLSSLWRAMRKGNGSHPISLLSVTLFYTLLLCPFFSFCVIPPLSSNLFSPCLIYPSIGFNFSFSDFFSAIWCLIVTICSYPGVSVHFVNTLYILDIMHIYISIILTFTEYEQSVCDITQDLYFVPLCFTLW